MKQPKKNTKKWCHVCEKYVTPLHKLSFDICPKCRTQVVDLEEVVKAGGKIEDGQNK